MERVPGGGEVTEPVLHVTFGASAAQTLRDALIQSGQKDKVIAFPDHLGFGPIDGPHPKSREEWMLEQLGLDDRESVQTKAETFWITALSGENRRILWFSKRSSAEYSGFLEWLWRSDNASCEIVDLTETMVTHRRKDGSQSNPTLALCLGILPAGVIVENNLLVRAKPLIEETRGEYISLWKRLRSENAAFRVVDDKGMHSAPITYFDPLLCAHTGIDWKKSARIVGEAMVDELDCGFFQMGDGVLFSRLQTLVKLGTLEGRGDMSNIQGSEVRLKAASKDEWNEFQAAVK